MAIVRKVDLKGDIIKGETITFNYPVGTDIDIISPEGTKTSYHLSLPRYLILIRGCLVSGRQLLKVLMYMVLQQFEVTDPTAKASEYNDLIQIIKRY
ncbi:Uncharacterised protein [Citrobacter koseri]|nr:Uncharacterised protein [Citrobacter koseri]